MITITMISVHINSKVFEWSLRVYKCTHNGTDSDRQIHFSSSNLVVQTTADEVSKKMMLLFLPVEKKRGGEKSKVNENSLSGFNGLMPSQLKQIEGD